jgi:hypothetical protein
MKVLDTSRGLLAIHNVIMNQRQEMVVSFTAKVLVGRRPNREKHQLSGPEQAG